MSTPARATLGLRRYQTILEAIRGGMSRGLARRGSLQGPVSLQWRLLGDCVEVRQADGGWVELDQAELERPFSHGVLALPAVAPLLRRDAQDLARARPRQRSSRQRWLLLSLRPKPPLLH